MRATENSNKSGFKLDENGIVTHVNVADTGLES